MGPTGKTDPVIVCIDSDVLIAGLFSRQGASHALLVLGEIGLLRMVLPEATVHEVRRNVEAKLPEALPAFERFLEAVAVSVHQPSAADIRRARGLAHPKDVPILAAALGSRAKLLATHNVRHYRPSSGVRIIRPGALIEEARAWFAGFGG